MVRCSLTIPKGGADPTLVPFGVGVQKILDILVHLEAEKVKDGWRVVGKILGKVFKSKRREISKKGCIVLRFKFDLYFNESIKV